MKQLGFDMKHKSVTSSRLGLDMKRKVMAQSQ